MATSKAAQQTGGRGVNFRSDSAGDSRNLGVDVRHTSESGYVVVAVLLMIFACLLLPLMAMLYFDSLALNKKTERTEARVEKLVKNLEEKDKK
jgi:hypothetical protein